MTDRFDQPGFWQQRLGQDIDLGVVGQRSLGRGYNESIYRRRVEVLAETLARSGIDCSKISVLDVGCGSGYYVGFWSANNTPTLCGLDISNESVYRLTKRFPEYRFVNCDITTEGAFQKVGEHFALATLFDVLYHIPDDEKALVALKNIRDCLLPGGYLLVFDQLLKNDYTMLAHVKFRGRRIFMDLLERAGFMLLSEQSLFIFLAPPIFGWRPLDICVSGIYKVIGYLLKWDRAGRAAGRIVYVLDRIARRVGITTPNHALFVIRKR